MKQLPIRIISKVVRGYGRGSKDLGIPTANVSREKGVLSCSCGDFDYLPTGIYWGFARVIEIAASSSGSGCINRGDSVEENHNAVIGKVHIAAISIGYNPTYRNKEKTVEPHLIADGGHPQRHASSCGETQFQDLYDKTIILSVVGYLRPEIPFDGIKSLTSAIKRDISDAEKLAGQSDPIILEEREWVKFSPGKN